MPRASKNTAKSSFFTKSFTLPNEKRSELIKILGGKGDELGDHKGLLPVSAIATKLGTAEVDFASVIYQVEYCLALLKYGAPHIDQAPKAQDYCKEFAAIQKSANELAARLNTGSSYYRDQLDTELVAFKTDTLKIVSALNQLALASNTIVTLYNGQTKVGTDTKTTLRLTLSSLIAIFDKHCQGASRKRIKRGAIVRLSEHEQRESEFVRVALLAADEMRVSNETLADVIREIKAARPAK